VNDLFVLYAYVMIVFICECLSLIIRLDYMLYDSLML
jgi:hypothetical protein